MSDAIKLKSFYDLSQMLEGLAHCYFKKKMENDLIDVIVSVAIEERSE